MSATEFLLAALFLIGVLWLAILLTNDEFEDFRAFEYDEIEERRRFNEAMDRHPAGKTEQ